MFALIGGTLSLARYHSKAALCQPDCCDSKMISLDGVSLVKQCCWQQVGHRVCRVLSMPSDALRSGQCSAELIAGFRRSGSSCTLMVYGAISKAPNLRSALCLLQSDGAEPCGIGITALTCLPCQRHRQVWPAVCHTRPPGGFHLPPALCAGWRCAPPWRPASERVRVESSRAGR